MEAPNLLAVLVAAFIPMIIGSLWYGPLFGRRWMALMETTEDEIRASFSPLKSYGGSLVASLVMAYVIAHILQAYDAAFEVAGWAAGLQTGFWCWLGFIVTFGWQSVAFEGKKLALYGLSMAYNLLTLLAMGVLLGLWR